MNSDFVARYRESDGTPQSLIEHLEGASALASLFAGKIGLPEFGELMGLLHDLGKYSKAFQAYIKSSEGRIEPDEDEYVDASRMKGKIDHSTAGAQYLLEHKPDSKLWSITADIMALCIASHHSGLIDCLSPDGTDVFSKRMKKSDEKSHYGEIKENLEEPLQDRIDSLLKSSNLENELTECFKLIGKNVPSQEIGQFRLGFMTRFLFSALIDADRLNSAERKIALTAD